MTKLLLTSMISTSVVFAAVNLSSCKGCHGANFEKSALGKSKIVKNMTKDEVSKALIGYKNDTYGGSMKHMMTNHVNMYSNKELSSTGLGTDEQHKKSIVKSSLKLDSCKGCHGANFEKAALGKSKIVANMTKTEVTAALIGYKHGTYGGSMKQMMTNHVKMYTDKELSQSGIGSNVYHKKIVASSINLTSCKGCHGANFEKSALGQSKVVANMTKEEVSKALIGYKNGTYGRSMKKMMSTHVNMYTDEELSSTGIGQ